MVITSAVSGVPQQSFKATQPEVASNNRQVASAVKLLNASDVAGDSRQFSVAIDPTTREAVVRIVDSSTNELVEQFPSEYILSVARELSERIAQQTSSDGR